ncbi:MAG: cache domain-containing protein [Bacteroidia bacterium]|nr:cache domain-containing protein [Bacteroidia bacterium]
MTRYQFKETRDLVSLVNDAAALFSKKGEDAFSEFRKEGSKWFSGSKYIFIYNLSGECIFHPVLKDLLGKNLSNLKDLNGKPIDQFIQSIASNHKKPFGWIHYLWAEPGEIFPSWKDAYIMGVKGPDGKTYAIGSGTFNIRTEVQFVVELVDSAAELIQKYGNKSYDHLIDKAGVFYFYNTYIFVLSTNGQLLVDPSYPINIGRNVIDFKDYSGHMIIREMLEKLKKEDVVYISYMWPAPGQANPSKKMIYARKELSGADTIIVGSSLYLVEPIWEKF